MSITVYESFRAVFYTPFYLPHALGAYEAEGVDVRLGTSPDLDQVATHLGAGQADVYWGGPMRILMNRDRDANLDLVGFCEAVTRDPFFLVGNRPNPDFTMRGLTGVTVATVSEVPTPWMCLQDDLRRAGIDPAGISRIADGTMAENAAALRAGSIDVAQIFQPAVEELVSSGAGHIWYAAANRGPCTYTTLYTVRRTLDEKADELHRMTRAMYRAQKWLHAHSGAEIGAALAGFFPDCPPEILNAAIDRYKSLGIWGRNPILPREGFERLSTALLSGGLIAEPIPYDACIDMRFAEAAVAEVR
ncbi:MAG: ABC transporter substrate-binding protein [Alphaproteobacteria bacterium]